MRSWPRLGHCTCEESVGFSRPGPKAHAQRAEQHLHGTAGPVCVAGRCSARGRGLADAGPPARVMWPACFRGAVGTYRTVSVCMCFVSSCMESFVSQYRTSEKLIWSIGCDVNTWLMCFTYTSIINTWKGYCCWVTWGSWSENSFWVYLASSFNAIAKLASRVWNKKRHFYPTVLPRRSTVIILLFRTYHFCYFERERVSFAISF